MDLSQIEKYNASMFTYKFIDFFIFRGRIIFLQKNGIVGGSGVYGPIKTVVNSIYDYIINEIKKRDVNESCYKRYINSDYNIKTLYPFNINYENIIREINTKRIKKLFDNKIKNIFNTDFINLISSKYLDYYDISNLTLEDLLIKVSSSDELLKKYIEKNIKILNHSPYIGYEKNDVTNITEISKGTGMIKYVQDYEFLNFEQYMLFDIYYNNDKLLQKIVNIFYETINIEKFNFNDYDLYDKKTINCIKKNDLMNIYLLGRSNRLASTIRYFILNLFAFNVKIDKILALINNNFILNKNNIINILFSFYQINNTYSFNYLIAEELKVIVVLIIEYFKNKNNNINEKIKNISKDVYKKILMLINIEFKNK